MPDKKNQITRLHPSISPSDVLQVTYKVAFANQAADHGLQTFPAYHPSYIVHRHFILTNLLRAIFFLSIANTYI